MGLPGMHISILALMLLLSLGSPIIHSCSEHSPRDSFTVNEGHRRESMIAKQKKRNVKKKKSLKLLVLKPCIFCLVRNYKNSLSVCFPLNCVCVTETPVLALVRHSFCVNIHEPCCSCSHDQPRVPNDIKAVVQTNPKLLT